MCVCVSPDSYATQQETRYYAFSYENITHVSFHWRCAIRDEASDRMKKNKPNCANQVGKRAREHQRNSRKVKTVIPPKNVNLIK